MIKRILVCAVLLICLMGVVQAQDWQGQKWEYATLSYAANTGGAGIPSLSFSGTPAPTATMTPPSISVIITTSNPDADAVLNQEIQTLLLPMIESGDSQYPDPRNVSTVLDYMGKQGWEVVSSALVLSFGGPSGTTYAFVLKRPIS